MATTGHESEVVDIQGLASAMAKAMNLGIPNKGICATAADTQAKTVQTGDGFTLAADAMVLVTFQNAISAASATLNVNSTGAKPIYYRGAALAAGMVKAGDTLTLRYDGSVFNVVGVLDQDISGKADKATTLAGYGITNAYTKSETYTKTEVNGLVDTPHQEYVTVDAYANLPATGSQDTIYRVSNYNGSTSQVDASVYSEYAWNGTQYIFLCVKSQIGEVFDISVYNNNAKYADLTAALGTNGANIPDALRKGGMSVKFVCTSDNKYVQYRLMANEWSTNESDWQGVDKIPTAGSHNLVESEGVFAELDKQGKGVVNINAVLGNNTAYTVSEAIAATPSKYRNLGTIITFRLADSGNKNARWQFNAATAYSETYWNDLTYWRNLDSPIGEIEDGNEYGVSGDNVYDVFTAENNTLKASTVEQNNQKPLTSGGLYNDIAYSNPNNSIITDNVLAKGDGNKLVRSRGVYDAVKYQSDFALIFELGSIGNTGNNAAGSARIRTKFYLKAPFRIELSSNYVFNSVFRYRIDANGVETFVDKTSYTETTLEETDKQYVYRAVLKRTDDAGTQSSDLTAAASVYKNSYNGLIAPSKWLAMGDSITYGWYSYFDGNTVQSAYNIELGYAAQVSRITGKPLVLRARPSAGYTATKNGQAVCAREDVDRIINYGLFDDIDLVTIAYGVNDWDDNCMLGSMSDAVTSENTNIIPSMRYVIERILATKPTIKIIILMPLNCAKNGNYAGNYGIGYAQSNNGTLEDIYLAFKTVCEYYGIEYIDLMHSSVVNRQNITTLLPDKVHPSLETHLMLARELSKKINCF